MSAELLSRRDGHKHGILLGTLNTPTRDMVDQLETAGVPAERRLGFEDALDGLLQKLSPRIKKVEIYFKANSSEIQVLGTDHTGKCNFIGVSKSV